MKEIYQLGFVLGRDYAISVAEIIAVLDKNKIKSTYYQPTNEILFVTSEDKSLKYMNLNNLGGSIKIFEIVGETTQDNLFGFIIKNFYPVQTEKRINFGISFYGDSSTKDLYKLGKRIKEYFSESNLSSRFVSSKESVLSSVIVTENKILTRGFEIILVKNKDRIMVGQTSAVQDYKAYSSRDFGRPKRDNKNGMTPPKLAQVMINLAKIDIDQILYDPFCGSGTILQEANLFGYMNIFGSDISSKQIQDSKDNLRWLEQTCYSNIIPDEHIFLSDILTPNKLLKVDAIVSEGFLGSPERRSYKKAKSDAEDLTSFYLKALSIIEKMVNKNGIIIMAIPFFVIEKEYIYLPILDKLNRIGLKAERPLPENINIRTFGRGNLTYSRPNQFVGREILILKK